MRCAGLVFVGWYTVESAARPHQTISNEHWVRKKNQFAVKTTVKRADIRHQYVTTQLLHVLFVSLWVSSCFSGLFPFPVHIVMNEFVDVHVCCLATIWLLIQCVLLPHP